MQEGEGRRPAVPRSAWALVVLFAVVVLPVVQEYTAPTAPRYTLAAAIVEHRTLELDRYRANVFVDRLEADGHLYSDKAPGQPFFSLPAYAAARAVGAESATVVRLRGNLGHVGRDGLVLRAPRASLLVLMMVIAARPLGERPAVVGAAGVAFGTLVLPYSAQLYGHLLGATLGFAAWLALRRSTTWRSALGAGLLVGAAVSRRVPAGDRRLGAGRLPRPSGLGARCLPYALGGLPAVAFLVAYQWVAARESFREHLQPQGGARAGDAPGDGHPQARPGLGDPLRQPRDPRFHAHHRCGPVGPLAARPAARDRSATTPSSGSPCSAGFFLLQAGWPNPWGGEMPGPRYMIPALPFLAVGIARAWMARPKLVQVLLFVSAFSMMWPLVAAPPRAGWRLPRPVAAGRRQRERLHADRCSRSPLVPVAGSCTSSSCSLRFAGSSEPGASPSLRRTRPKASVAGRGVINAASAQVAEAHDGVRSPARSIVATSVNGGGNGSATSTRSSASATARSSPSSGAGGQIPVPGEPARRANPVGGPRDLLLRRRARPLRQAAGRLRVPEVRLANGTHRHRHYQQRTDRGRTYADSGGGELGRPSLQRRVGHQCAA